MDTARPPRTSATIYEAARLAGVSIATVSRVLNGKPGVNVKTRQRVLDACAEIGFSPNPVARQLTSGPEKTVGLFMAPRQVTGGYYSLMYADLVDALDKRGLLARQMETRPDGTPASWVKGYILMGVGDDDLRLRRLREAHVPHVVLGPGEPDCFTVKPDDIEGQALAVRHLAGLGRKRIAHLSGHPDNRVPNVRLAGYKRGLEQVGLPFDPALVLDGDFTALGGYRALRRAFDAGLTLDGIAAASDDMAVGALAAIEDAGLKAPEDVAVVGFDGLPFHAGKLTSVRQDLVEIAEVAATLLDEAIAGGPPREVTVPVELVLGESSVGAAAAG
jgi:LacI family transcriptional regulator